MTLQGYDSRSELVAEPDWDAVRGRRYDLI
jgi:hypothetical protein